MNFSVLYILQYKEKTNTLRIWLSQASNQTLTIELTFQNLYYKLLFIWQTKYEKIWKVIIQIFTVIYFKIYIILKMEEWLTTEAVCSIDVTLKAVNSCPSPFTFSILFQGWYQTCLTMPSYSHTGKTQVVKQFLKIHMYHLGAKTFFFFFICCMLYE